MRIRSVLYISTASNDLPPRALEALLDTARRNNARLGLTGMLLYHERTFMQTLEGPPRVVEDMCERIIVDERHFGLVRLLDREIESREFSAWAMAFESVTAQQLRSCPDWVGLSDWDGRGDFVKDPGTAHRLLQHFQTRLAA